MHAALAARLPSETSSNVGCLLLQKADDFGQYEMNCGRSISVDDALIEMDLGIAGLHI